MATTLADLARRARFVDEICRICEESSDPEFVSRLAVFAAREIEAIAAEREALAIEADGVVAEPTVAVAAAAHSTDPEPEPAPKPRWDPRTQPSLFQLHPDIGRHAPVATGRLWIRTGAGMRDDGEVDLRSPWPEIKGNA